jgi:hypothetical protein
MDVRVPRTNEGQLKLPGKIGADDAYVIYACNVYHVRLEVREFPKDLACVTLKNRVIGKVLVKGE